MLQQNFIVIELPKEGAILIPQFVLNKLYEYKQTKFWHREKGGIFLGKYRGKSIEITDITLPQDDDSCGRFFFNRCSPFHQQSAYQQWRESNAEITYVGEWHTHPEHTASPSSQDINEWQSKLSTNHQSMLLCIIGRNTNWFGCFQKGIISKLEYK